MILPAVRIQGANEGVVVVGNALVDRTLSLSNPVSPGTGAWVIEKKDHPGGVEANVGAALRKLGIPVGAVTPLGDDAEADWILGELTALGIDVSHVAKTPGDETAYCLILVAPGADRIILGGGTGVRKMRLSPEQKNYIRQWKVVFTSAYVPVPVLDDIACFCHGSGSPPLLAFDLPDTFDDLEVRGFFRSDLDRLLPAIDLFMANRVAVCSYTGTASIREAIPVLRARGLRRGALTDGQDGSWLIWGQKELFIHPYHITAVDPTGAGDAYHAALIASWLLESRPPCQAGQFASAAGALNCREMGARNGLPSRAEIEALIAEGGSVR